MTRLLEEAVATVAKLPDEQQDELARVLLRLAGHEQPLDLLSPDENANLDASILAERRGEFASEDDIRVVWAKHGR